ncbi:hypothetical protein OEB99_07095 [Actinotalea sp. M2MS4P-6]|uniref:hypothetical protein n=1 Tax=Actinotalea sp. M2MS4P-6 TaxID=2983762 RepID=UPI0021E4F7CD|nr:hypothetical protein [Actinotalea sp. M2MS4P-6]MCV2394067.1 hypothetical protein [Actinotalea sp. M2MS4P-6]
MLSRVLASLLCLLGAAAIALGVASATVWRSSDTLAATASASGYLVTDPGVLDLAADEVTVTASATGPVTIALGRTADVEAWVGEDEATRVTGLATLTELTTEAGQGVSATSSPTATDAPSESATDTASATESPEPTDSATESADPSATESADASATESGDDAASGEDGEAAFADPSGSDLWLTEATGDGRATMTWERTDGRWSVLVAAASGDDVALTLTWPQEVTTPWLRPGVAGGSVLLVLGIAWWALILVRSRRAVAGVGAAGWFGHARDVLGSGRPSRAPSPTEGTTSVATAAESAAVPPVAFSAGRRAALSAVSASDTSVAPGATAGGLEQPPAAAGEPGPAEATGPRPSTAAQPTEILHVSADGAPMTRRQLRELREREERERAELAAADRHGRRPRPEPEPEPAATPGAPQGTGPAADTAGPQPGAVEWPRVGTVRMPERTASSPETTARVWPATAFGRAAGSDQAAPDQAVPDRAVPDRAVSDRAVPARAVPARAVPETPVPEAVTGRDTSDQAELDREAARTGLRRALDRAMRRKPATPPVAWSPLEASGETPEVPELPEPPAASSPSADAWRRAWGLPGTAPGANHDQGEEKR